MCYHGQFRWRPKATAGGFEGRTTQQIVPLFGQRFAIHLTKGEMVVITADHLDPESTGRYFFTGSEEEGPVQRLLLVRLANMSKTEGLYAE